MNNIIDEQLMNNISYISINDINSNEHNIFDNNIFAYTTYVFIYFCTYVY